MKDKIKIINGLAVLPDRIGSVSIEIEGGIITDINNRKKTSKSELVIDARGKFILPGFVDIHTNGIAGFDLSNGVYELNSGNFISDESNYIKGLNKALKAYAKTGVTRVLLTSLASPLEQLKKVFGFINLYKSELNNSPWKEILEGLYIEGTFIKLHEYRGAHNPEYFNKPSIKLFDELQKASGRLIKIVNVVPEWGEDSLKLIKYLSKNNIVCAAGHTGATGTQYQQAIKNGLTLAIHFLNGPTGSSSKPFGEGGAVENILRSKEMFVEIITDGYHVDKSYVLDTIKRKGFDKICVITDSMFAAAFKGLKRFNVFGIDGSVSKDGKYLQISDREYSLFGSLLTMDKAFSNILTWLTNPIYGVWNELHSPLSYEEAIIKATAMCSKNPAEVLGMYEPSNDRKNNVKNDLFTGSLEVGKSADIIIAEIKKINKNYKLKIGNVIVKGQML